VEEHRQQLLRCLRRGVERADPAVAQEIEADSGSFRLIGWNPLYYQSYKPLDEDLPWIDVLLKQDGPTHKDVREALSFRRRRAWLLYTLADISIFLFRCCRTRRSRARSGKPRVISAMRTTSGNRCGNCSRHRCGRCLPGASVFW